MEILICILIFCVFIIFINFFSTRYIQFLYRKMYAEHRQELDTALNYGAVPERWRKRGKAGCIKRLGRLKKFVAQDRFFSSEEKESLMSQLDDLKEEWTSSDPEFFSGCGAMKKLKKVKKAENEIHV